MRTIPPGGFCLVGRIARQDTSVGGGASVLVPHAPKIIDLPPEQRPARLELKASETLRCPKPPEGGLRAERAARATGREATIAKRVAVWSWCCRRLRRRCVAVLLAVGGRIGW